MRCSCRTTAATPAGARPYSRLNIGDPGGAEFDDILAGIDHCIAEGFADADRLGVTGASYGGYMTAWAVATTNRFKAAVMVSGISNQWSCHYSCNHDFGEFIVGGPLKDEALPQARHRPLAAVPARQADDADADPARRAETAARRSARARNSTARLLERGVPAELVVYPREGHGFQERGHRLDAWRRHGRLVRPLSRERRDDAVGRRRA